VVGQREREREGVSESVCVWCLSGGSFNSSLSSVESFRARSPLRSSFSEEPLYLLSSPFLYYFGSSRSLPLLSCFYSFLSRASPFLPLATHQFLSILLSDTGVPPWLPAPLLLRPPRLRRTAAGRAERGSPSPRLQPLAPHASRALAAARPALPPRPALLGLPPPPSLPPGRAS